jgi:ABC-type sugar transport system permease subunit
MSRRGVSPYLLLLPALLVLGLLFVGGLVSAMQQSLGMMPGSGSIAPTLRHYQALIGSQLFSLHKTNFKGKTAGRTAGGRRLSGFLWFYGGVLCRLGLPLFTGLYRLQNQCWMRRRSGDKRVRV